MQKAKILKPLQGNISNFAKIDKTIRLSLSIFGTREDIKNYQDLASLVKKPNFFPSPKSWKDKFSSQAKGIMKGIFRTFGLL